MHFSTSFCFLSSLKNQIKQLLFHFNDFYSFVFSHIFIDTGLFTKNETVKTSSNSCNMKVSRLNKVLKIDYGLLKSFGDDKE